MKTNLLKNVLLLAAGLLLTAACAHAMTFSATALLDGGIVYPDTGAEYVALTDLTPPASAPVQLISSSFANPFQIGVYSHDGRQVTGSLVVVDTAQGWRGSSLVFDLAAGTASSSSSGETAPLAATFGFYFRPYTDDLNLGGLLYYSDQDLGEGDAFSVFHDPWGIPSARYAEVVVGIELGGQQALFYVKDVAPAAVPLPTSLVLLGTGLASMVLVARKRGQAE